ncbi:photosystem II oxygen evolving complex protein PsbP [Coccomyxa subellipsoidea C-169]|uniref:Photosystem II oxygen evolving complex protein PsbP n=1 Tax=Coccomyxa subellipsoidea (strain C-169) TaxID=574566 RepID=I0Z2Y6_COCSC|nr:photosystem II oxygen evolving complex protein PsbP [Coccomyxa subellipsoidea C-169]EIE25005.1 photosystem II oxygen evolving complex protein PsbP [Coccomyxa subellipsoidea C-169]|eukprot:XP_005649549.1 photosystem II oxygen evolving complex protein PsbP [Coccomyxa subellipsoidea C-169]
MQTISAKPFAVGQELKVRARSTAVSAVRSPVVVRASQDQESAVARRGVLAGVAGSIALLSGVRPSEAAFGEAARVFGSKATNSTGFVPYSGEGFALLLPSKYNPSKEKEFPGTQLRYEDNGDAVNSIAVMVRSTTKNSIEEYGTPDKFLDENKNLLGAQVFKGESRSEGGFAPNKVSVASLLDVQQAKDKKGKTYYKYEILTRTADGDEGGRHQLITAAVGNGNLYILKVQVGDKRWFKGADAGAKGTWNSFVVA